MYMPSFWIQVPLLHGFKNRDERNERCIVFQNVFQGQPASWRDFHTATAIGRYMYIYGGRGNSQTVNLCGLCCLVMVGSMGSVYFFFCVRSGDALGGIHSNQEIYDAGIVAFDTGE